MDGVLIGMVAVVVFFMAMCCGFEAGRQDYAADPSAPKDEAVFTVECFSGGVRIWSTDKAKTTNFVSGGLYRITTDEGNTYVSADCVQYPPIKN